MSDLDNLTVADYDIILLHVIKDPKVFAEFCSKTRSSTFDPVTLKIHDFIAGVLGEIWKERGRYIGTPSIRLTLIDRLKDSQFEDSERKEIIDLFDYFASISDTDLDSQLALDLLQKVINRQVTVQAREDLIKALEDDR